MEPVGETHCSVDVIVLSKSQMDETKPLTPVAYCGKTQLQGLETFEDLIALMPTHERGQTDTVIMTHAG